MGCVLGNAKYIGIGKKGETIYSGISYGTSKVKSKIDAAANAVEFLAVPGHIVRPQH